MSKIIKLRKGLDINLQGKATESLVEVPMASMYAVSPLDYENVNPTLLVKVGDKVSRGDQIATMGNTGKSKGVHLHYEVIYRERRVNPLNYYNEDVRGEEYKEMVRPK